MSQSVFICKLNRSETFTNINIKSGEQMYTFTKDVLIFEL